MIKHIFWLSIGILWAPFEWIFRLFKPRGSKIAQYIINLIND